MERRSFIIAGVCMSVAVSVCDAQAKRPVGKPLLVTVPFVGCKGDGQTGPLGPPKGKPRTVAIDAKLAARLAFYESPYGEGALAPRGWDCFGTMGSSGDSLMITPRKAVGKLPGTLGGPAVLLSVLSAAASGRFGIAEIVARVFPTFKAFAMGVAGELVHDDIVFGPYPHDNLTYKNERFVEYTTPGGTEGLGTLWSLKPNHDAIEGVSIISGDPEEPDLLHLCVRLPKEFHELTPAIIHQVEIDAAAHPRQ